MKMTEEHLVHQMQRKTEKRSEREFYEESRRGCKRVENINPRQQAKNALRRSLKDFY